MLFVKHSEDKDKLQEIVQKDENFKAIPRETAEVIKAVTGTQISIDQRRKSK